MSFLSLQKIEFEFMFLSSFKLAKNSINVFWKKTPQKVVFESYLTYLFFCVKFNLLIFHLKEKYLISRRATVWYLLGPFITVKSVALFWCKSYHEVRRFPPICHSYLRDCFWDLICWKEVKDFEILTDTDETDCSKSTQKFQAESGGIFTSKKENNISNVDVLSVSREKIHSATTLQK